MYGKMKYFLGGVASALGVAVLITDPENLENALTFPKRIVSAFYGDSIDDIGLGAYQILLEGRLRKEFDEYLDIPDAHKDRLAKLFANKCVSMIEGGVITSDSPSQNHLVVGDRAEAGRNDFGTVVDSPETSIEGVPGLSSGCLFMAGITLGVLGETSVRDHVANPGRIRLNDSAIRLAEGGGLFQLPIDYEAMRIEIDVE